MSYQRLGDLLVSAGIIDENSLERALRIQKTERKRLGAVLIESGEITERQLIEAAEYRIYRPDKGVRPRANG